MDRNNGCVCWTLGAEAPRLRRGMRHLEPGGSALHHAGWVRPNAGAALFSPACALCSLCRSFPSPGLHLLPTGPRTPQTRSWTGSATVTSAWAGATGKLCQTPPRFGKRHVCLCQQKPTSLLLLWCLKFMVCSRRTWCLRCSMWTPTKDWRPGRSSDIPGSSIGTNCPTASSRTTIPNWLRWQSCTRKSLQSKTANYVTKCDPVRLSSGCDGSHLLRPEELPTPSRAEAHRELLPGPKTCEEASFHVPVETRNHRPATWRLTQTAPSPGQLARGPRVRLAAKKHWLWPRPTPILWHQSSCSPCPDSSANQRWNGERWRRSMGGTRADPRVQVFGCIGAVWLLECVCVCVSRNYHKAVFDRDDDHFSLQIFAVVGLSFSLLHARLPVRVVHLCCPFCRVDELYMTRCAAERRCAIGTKLHLCPTAVKCFWTFLWVIDISAITASLEHPKQVNSRKCWC